MESQTDDKNNEFIDKDLQLINELKFHSRNRNFKDESCINFHYMCRWTNIFCKK